jgi:hypothetical protein
MQQVFPATGKTITQLSRGKKILDYSAADERQVHALEDAGIDMDPEVWTLKLRLRGGTWAYHVISGIEQKRLWSRLQTRDSASFIVFDAATQRVAINPRHILTWQFLWDAPNRKSAEEHADGVRLFFADSENFATFEIDADQAEPGDEDNDGPTTQLQDLLVTLELAGGEGDTVVSFEDADGEHVFLVSSEVSMIEIPLWAVEPI